MRHLFGAAALAVLASTAAADPVFGTWKSPDGETGGYVHVQIAACGGKICGKIVKVFNNANTSSEGRMMIRDMEAQGGGKYRGGKVWTPDQDKTYRGKMTLTGNALKVEGCVLGGAVCRGGTFTRIN